MLCTAVLKTQLKWYRLFVCASVLRLDFGKDQISVTQGLIQIA